MRCVAVSIRSLLVAEVDVYSPPKPCSKSEIAAKSEHAASCCSATLVRGNQGLKLRQAGLPAQLLLHLLLAWLLLSS